MDEHPDPSAMRAGPEFDVYACVVQVGRVNERGDEHIHLLSAPVQVPSLPNYGGAIGSYPCNLPRLEWRVFMIGTRELTERGVHDNLPLPFRRPFQTAVPARKHQTGCSDDNIVARGWRLHHLRSSAYPPA